MIFPAPLRSVLCLAALLLTACRPAGERGANGGAAGRIVLPPPPPGNVLRMGNGDEPEDLDPHIVTGALEHNIIMSLLEGLTSEDPATGGPVPGAAERWEIRDHRIYTFHLRPNGRWSDGTPVTAEDFRFSYERILTPTLGSKYAYMLHIIEGAQAFNEGKTSDFSTVGVKALDPLTLEITLVCPTAYFLQGLSHYSWFPVSKATILRHGAIDARNTGWTRAGSFVGNGPFLLQEWKVNERIHCARNPHYWNASGVRLDGLEFLPIKDQNTEERMFRSGQLHRTTTLPVAKVGQYRERNPELIRIDPYLGTYYYLFNTTRKPFDDPRVRRALALAVSREEIVEKILRGGQTPAYHLTFPDIAGYTSRHKLEGGLEDARRLLAEAGYPGGAGFPRFEILYNTSENHRVIAEVIQEQWKRGLGIDCGLRNQEWKVYMESRRTMDYDVARAGWISDYEDPMSYMDLMFKDGGNNHTGWHNEEYERLVRDAACDPDPASRREKFQQAEAFLVREVPVMPIYFYKSVYLLRPEVKGWHPNKLDHHPYQHVWLEP
jgi:oligopeptide transport system substrate-binding protein